MENFPFHKSLKWPLTISKNGQLEKPDVKLISLISPARHLLLGLVSFIYFFNRTDADKVSFSGFDRLLLGEATFFELCENRQRNVPFLYSKLRKASDVRIA